MGDFDESNRSNCSFARRPEPGVIANDGCTGQWQRNRPIGSGGLARNKGVVRLATCLRPSRLLATLGLLVITE
jgi:hypothetical protein